MEVFLFGFGVVLVGRAGDDGGFFEVVLGRRGRRLPLKTSGAPGIGRGALAVFQRPEQIDDGKQVADAENGSAGAGKDVIDLEFAGISVIAARHAEIAHDELREEGEIETDVGDERGELTHFFRIHASGDFWPPIMQSAHESGDHSGRRQTDR